MAFFIKICKNVVNFQLLSLSASTEVGLRKQFMEILKRNEKNPVIFIIDMFKSLVKFWSPFIWFVWPFACPLEVTPRITELH